MVPSAKVQHPAPHDAALMMADGSVFFGYGIGKPGTTLGEICFNTSITGYQEILTDPSYCGQVITFTFPHIGNVGTNPEDIESAKPAASGLIIRDTITNPSNFRSTQHFNDWLKKHNLTGICDVDTRAITRHIRLNGAQNVAIAYKTKGEIDLKALKKKLVAHPSMKGLELAAGVSCKKPHEWKEGLWSLELSGKEKAETRNLKPETSKYHVVAVDFGVKYNILRCLADAGCRVTVVPAKTSAKDVLAYQPDGVFLSNGPGDPAATGKYALPMIAELIESGLPIFGICLGHQMLGIALGGKTEKMKQGHRGANHPVKELSTGRVMITSQNHGFTVSKDGLPKDVEVTHISLFDGTIQGIRHKTKPIFSVQGHPEASPGPHDTQELFDRFVETIKTTSKSEAKSA